MLVRSSGFSSLGKPPTLSPVFINAIYLLSVLPTLTGSCDSSHFYISVKFGNQGKNFQTMVGAREVTPDLAELYNFQENGTHFSLKVSYVAEDTVFEVA